jgi:hypothetical protein
VSVRGDPGALDVAFDGNGELGDVGVADDAAELALGFEHAGGGPPETRSRRTASG